MMQKKQKSKQIMKEMMFDTMRSKNRKLINKNQDTIK